MDTVEHDCTKPLHAEGNSEAREILLDGDTWADKRTLMPKALSKLLQVRVA